MGPTKGARLHWEKKQVEERVVPDYYPCLAIIVSRHLKAGLFPQRQIFYVRTCARRAWPLCVKLLSWTDRRYTLAGLVRKAMNSRWSIMLAQVSSLAGNKYFETEGASTMVWSHA
jgi:hypothetical protein